MILMYYSTPAVIIYCSCCRQLASYLLILVSPTKPDNVVSYTLAYPKVGYAPFELVQTAEIHLKINGIVVVVVIAIKLYSDQH